MIEKSNKRKVKTVKTANYINKLHVFETEKKGLVNILEFQKNHAVFDELNQNVLKLMLGKFFN